LICRATDHETNCNLYPAGGPGLFGLFFPAYRHDADLSSGRMHGVYNAKTVATDSTWENLGHVTLFQVLLSPFLRGFSCSADLFTTARVVMVGLFWLNLVLVTLASGEKYFRSEV